MAARFPESPPHFIVIVPGIMGSKLRDKTSGKLAWVDFASLTWWNPLLWDDWLDDMLATLRYPNDRLEPAGIMDQVIFVPPWAKQEQYSRLVDSLEGMGYRADPTRHGEDELDVYSFAYDWRQDNRISARQLAQAIERWQSFHPSAKVWIIAHSMGGMVSRWYIEKEGGKDNVGRLLLMGSPWDGAPKALHMLFSGFDTFFRRRFSLFNIGKRTRDVIRTFPSAYQLLPYENPFLRDANNTTVDLYTAAGWLEDDEQRRLLLDGQAFNQELGKTLSVETLCFFGAKKLTTSAGLVRAVAQGRWSEIVWETLDVGDGTVPERSAVHPEAREKLPFVAGHGDIYVDPAVIEKLEWELIRKYRLGGVLAELETDELRIVFEPDDDIYSPGQAIRVWATVHRRDGDIPISDADVWVQPVWDAALPGDTAPAVGDALLPVRLAASAGTPGRYDGSLAAPNAEGYYTLRARVDVPGQPSLELHELILVEAAPEEQAHQVAAFESFIPTTEPVERDVDMTPVPPLPQSGDRRGFDSLAGGTPRGINGGGTLSVDDGSAEPTEDTAPANDNTQPAPEQRFLKAGIEGHDPATPLRRGAVYSLAFEVDTDASGVVVGFDDGRVFAEGETLVELDVNLSHDGFKMWTREPQSLFVPRSGSSKGKVRFNIEPRRAGEGTVTAWISKDNNFIQAVRLTLRSVEEGQPAQDGEGAIVKIEDLGRSVDGAFAVQPREVTLFIEKKTDGFNFIMATQGGTWNRATLRLELAYLDGLIDVTRQALLDVVYLGKGVEGTKTYPRPRAGDAYQPEFFYQRRELTIPDDVNQQALRRLAEAGWLLFNRIFMQNAGEDARLIGRQLRELARQAKLKIEIVTEQFLVPWGILYLGEQVGTDPIDPELFLGYKHIVEVIPLNTRQGSVPQLAIASQPKLSVGVNVDPDIKFIADVDARTGRTRSVIDKQLDYWNKRRESGVEHIRRQTDSEVFAALANGTTSDQILYFFCHAESLAKLDNPVERDQAYLRFKDKKRVTLQQLELNGSQDVKLPGAPLVFINACESAGLSPVFYGGFMPYFVAKGARGMIGTECEVPAHFAAEWAERFFDKFLGGKPLGQAFWELRREFYQEHRNILGLVYALYCDGDTRVAPGLQLE